MRVAVSRDGGGGRRGSSSIAGWRRRAALVPDRLTFARSPGPRGYGSLLYDPGLDRLVLFGGGTGTADPTILWEWDGGTWQRLPPVISAVINLRGDTSGGETAGIAADPATDTIYVTGHQDSNTVWAVSARTRTVTATIDVPGEALAIAADPATSTVYVVTDFKHGVSDQRQHQHRHRHHPLADTGGGLGESAIAAISAQHKRTVTVSDDQAADLESNWPPAGKACPPTRNFWWPLSPPTRQRPAVALTELAHLTAGRAELLARMQAGPWQGTMHPATPACHL